ncbi:MAG: CTP synthetase [Candidatus Puniceispirillum sp.]|nr:CTP synthetase [Candidatus Puniceispirillum sp.]
MTYYIFVTGGVSSSLGKGLAAASLGALLQERGFKVRLRKFEPYINVDPGTMSPFQHGEVFVTDDGAETDLDLGHYERFTGVAARSTDAVSTGQIYSHVISKERRGDYLGATVQVIPHITDAIQEFIVRDVEEDVDFLITEIGGTVGDIEGLPFIEAIRQFAHGAGRGKTLFMHLTLVPYIASAAELKTKPAQHSVKELQRMGIQPDILLCRTEKPLPESARQKLALFCNMPPECVIEARDVETTYEVPITYSQAGLDEQVLRRFGLEAPRPNLEKWHTIVDHFRAPKRHASIAIVGKYTGLKDAYKSLGEALIHAALAHEGAVSLSWIDASTLENHDSALPMSEIAQRLSSFDGILIPGGHGERGSLGKMAAITYARENNIPCLGICLGLQLSVIEFARNVLGIKDAVSSEFSDKGTHLVGLLTEWDKDGVKETRTSGTPLGGTMRLGAYTCDLVAGSKSHEAYGAARISERHRHRYEVNMAYAKDLAAKGLLISGVSPDGKLPEMIELKDHAWFVATQAHPEFKSRPFAPHPLFLAFVGACFDHEHKKERAL